MKNKVLTAIVSIVLASACLFTVACSGKQTSLQNKTDLPTQSATEAPTQAAERYTPIITPVPQWVLDLNKGAEPFALPKYDYAYDEDKYEQSIIFFPKNHRGRTEYDGYHYDIIPFTVHMILPNGWTYREFIDQEERIPVMGFENFDYEGGSRVRSTLWFFDAEGRCVAGIGYEVFEESVSVAEHTTPNLRAVYRSIANESYAYRFAVTSQYDIVPNPWNNETAITFTTYTKDYVPPELYDEMTNENSYQNPAIVSCDYDAEVYIAMEFDHRYVDDDLVMEIAKSIRLISKGAK